MCTLHDYTIITNVISKYYMYGFTYLPVPRRMVVPPQFFCLYASICLQGTTESVIFNGNKYQIGETRRIKRTKCHFPRARYCLFFMSNGRFELMRTSRLRCSKSDLLSSLSHNSSSHAVSWCFISVCFYLFL